MAKKVLIVTEAKSGDEAMYIDGEKVLDDSTIYACSIAAQVKGMEIELRHESVDMGVAWTHFPEYAADLPEFETVA